MYNQMDDDVVDGVSLLGDRCEMVLTRIFKLTFHFLLQFSFMRLSSWGNKSRVLSFDYYVELKKVSTAWIESIDLLYVSQFNLGS